MITAHPDLLLVPFGTARFHPGKFELAGFAPDGLRLWTATPCVLIDRARRAPLRLNSVPLPIATPGIAEAARDLDGELVLLREHLARLCGAWTKPPLKFLQRYFEEIRATIDRHRGALVQRAAPFAGLYEAEHWAFSALLPLPRAHLHLPSGGARVSFAADDVVRVDFAFWTGRTLVAVVLGGRRTPTPAERRRRERLDAWGITVREVDPERFADAPDGGLLAYLGPAFSDFWQSERLPSGPPRSHQIAQPVGYPPPIERGRYPGAALYMFIWNT